MTFSHLYRTLPAIVAAVVVVASAHAQTDYRSSSTRMLSVGAGFAGGASVTLEPPEGSKVKPIFAWRLTADASYPLNPTISAMLSLGLDSRGVRTHGFDNNEVWADTRISYFSITPAFKFSVVTLGVNFGLPLGASNSFSTGTTVDASDAFVDQLNTLIEPRLGVLIPVLEEKIGWLGLSLGAGVSVNEIFETPQTDDNNQMVSGHLGMTWQFGIKGTGR